MRHNGGNPKQWTQLPATGKHEFSAPDKCSDCGGRGYIGNVVRRHNDKHLRFALYCHCAKVTMSGPGKDFECHRVDEGVVAMMEAEV